MEWTGGGEREHVCLFMFSFLEGFYKHVCVRSGAINRPKEHFLSVSIHWEKERERNRKVLPGDNEPMFWDYQRDYLSSTITHAVKTLVQMILLVFFQTALFSLIYRWYFKNVILIEGFFSGKSCGRWFLSFWVVVRDGNFFLILLYHYEIMFDKFKQV